jgi:hypothetical protein
MANRPRQYETAEGMPASAIPALTRSGWVSSYNSRRPEDADGNPLPWYTYAAISFLEPLVSDGLSVFEFGSGNSTLWWAERARRVTSVEHNPEWGAIMEDRLPPNVAYRQVPLSRDGEYCRVAEREEGPFDVIVIDGRDRNNCALHSLSALAPDGVIIWDNSERDEYEPGYAFLGDHGFRRLRFSGMGPVNARPWETSVFYRSANNLGI